MTKNERVYGVIGTIGNGEELINARRRVEPHTSFHVCDESGEEFAIRYTMRDAMGAMRGLEDSIKFKPIFKQSDPVVSHESGCIRANCPMGCN